MKKDKSTLVHKYWRSDQYFTVIKCTLNIFMIGRNNIFTTIKEQISTALVPISCIYKYIRVQANPKRQRVNGIQCIIIIMVTKDSCTDAQCIQTHCNKNMYKEKREVVRCVKLVFCISKKAQNISIVLHFVCIEYFHIIK